MRSAGGLLLLLTSSAAGVGCSSLLGAEFDVVASPAPDDRPSPQTPDDRPSPQTPDDRPSPQTPDASSEKARAELGDGSLAGTDSASPHGHLAPDLVQDGAASTLADVGLDAVRGDAEQPPLTFTCETTWEPHGSTTVGTCQVQVDYAKHTCAQHGGDPTRCPSRDPSGARCATAGEHLVRHGDQCALVGGVTSTARYDCVCH